MKPIRHSLPTVLLLLVMVEGTVGIPPINDGCTSALPIAVTAAEREEMLQNDLRQTGLVIPIDNREATLEAELWAWNNGQTSTGQCNEGGIARPDSTSYKRGTGVTHDIWYTFTGYEAGRLSLSTCGLTTWQSVISVYEGGVEECESVVNNRRSEFNCVAIDYYTTTDSICRPRHLDAGADVYLEVRPGDTYLIRVSTVNGVGEGTMQVKFEPSFPSPPECSLSSSSVQCQNGGTCNQHTNQCVCPRGYFGLRCQHSAGCSPVEEGQETVLCETYQQEEGLAAVGLPTNHNYNRGDVTSKLTTCGQYGAMLGVFTVEDELSVAVNKDTLPKGTYRVVGHVLAVDNYSGWSEIGVRVNHGIGEKYRTEASSSHPTFNEIDTDRNGWKHPNQCGDLTNYWRLFGNNEIELLVDFTFTLTADLDTSTSPLDITLFNYGWDQKFGLLSFAVHGPATAAVTPTVSFSTFSVAQHNNPQPDAASEVAYLKSLEPEVPTQGYCKKSVSSLAWYSNQMTCGGTTTNVGYHISIHFEERSVGGAVWAFRFGADWGTSSVILIDGVVAHHATHDIWWGGSWSNSVISPSQHISGGVHTVEVWAREACCDGGSSVQFQRGGPQHGVWTDLTVDGLQQAVGNNIVFSSFPSTDSTTTQTTGQDEANYITNLEHDVPPPSYCKRWVTSLTPFSNQITCGGTSSNIGYHISIQFEEREQDVAHWYFRFGADWGISSVVLLDDTQLLHFATSDMWWAENWGLAVTVGPVSVSKGLHVIDVFAREQCCDGGSAAQFKRSNTDDWMDLTLHNLNRMHEFGARSNGYCLRPDGADQNSGVMKAEGSDYWSDVQCLQWCEVQQQDTTACEFIWDQDNRGCYQHTQPVGSPNGVDRHYCWIAVTTTGKQQDVATKYTTQSTTATGQQGATTTAVNDQSVIFNVNMFVGMSVVVVLTVVLVLSVMRRRPTTQQQQDDPIAELTQIPL